MGRMSGGWTDAGTPLGMEIVPLATRLASETGALPPPPLSPSNGGVAGACAGIGFAAGWVFTGAGGEAAAGIGAAGADGGTSVALTA